MLLCVLDALALVRDLPVQLLHTLLHRSVYCFLKFGSQKGHHHLGYKGMSGGILSIGCGRRRWHLYAFPHGLLRHHLESHACVGVWELAG